MTNSFFCNDQTFLLMHRSTLYLSPHRTLKISFKKQRNFCETWRYGTRFPCNAVLTFLRVLILCAIAFWAETPCSLWLFLVMISLHLKRLWPLGSFRRDRGTFFPAIFWIAAGNNHIRHFWYKYKYYSVVSNGKFYSVFHNSLSLFSYNYLSIY